jgi:hypothetical protein
MMCGERGRTTSVYELCLAKGIFTIKGSWVWRTNDVTIWAHNNCTVRRGGGGQGKTKIHTYERENKQQRPQQNTCMADSFWLCCSVELRDVRLKKASLTRLWPISWHNAATFLQIFTAYHEKSRSGYPVFGPKFTRRISHKRHIRQ